jgi:uncharacterized repeat protein (TIGR03803 family)
MRHKHLWLVPIKLAALGMAGLALSAGAAAQRPQNSPSRKEKVLYSFKGGNDGAVPIGNLVADAVGNLYGVTEYGGAYGSGTIFKLTRSAHGWKESVLHTFGTGNDGVGPFGLAIDGVGHIYGTTIGGGGAQKLCPEGCGTVFTLIPTSSGHWKETVLHRFRPSEGDGSNPYAPPVLDRSGSLYGTTAYGGTGSCNGGCGAVFRVIRTKSGRWKEDVLYSFHGTDGRYAESTPIFDSTGNLYGTTAFGGEYDNGVAFKLSPSKGGWTETLLHNFAGSTADGAFPGG